MFTDPFEVTSYYYTKTSATELQSPRVVYGRKLLSTPHCESHGFQENRAQHIEKSSLYRSRTIVDKECFLPVSLRKLRWTYPFMNSKRNGNVVRVRTLEAEQMG